MIHMEESGDSLTTKSMPTYVFEVTREKVVGDPPIHIYRLRVNRAPRPMVLPDRLIVQENTDVFASVEHLNLCLKGWANALYMEDYWTNALEWTIPERHLRPCGLRWTVEGKGSFAIREELDEDGSVIDPHA